MECVVVTCKGIKRIWNPLLLRQKDLDAKFGVYSHFIPTVRDG